MASVVSIPRAFCALGFALIWWSLCGYTAKLFVSPVYFAISAGVLCLLLGSLLSQRLKVTGDLVISLCLLLYVLLIHSSTFLATKTGAYPNLVLGLAAYVCVRLAAPVLSSRTQESIAIRGLWLGIALLGADSAYRLANPTIPDGVSPELYEEDGLAFYIFKYGSLMFADSNTTALVALVFLSFYIALRYTGSAYRNRLLPILCVTLVLASLSRAAILTLAVVSALYILARYVRSPALAFLSGIAILAVGTFAAVALFGSDSSVQLKLATWGDALSFHRRSTAEIFFGVGIGQSERELGIHTHALALTYFFELGSIGFCLFSLWVATVAYRAKALYWPLIILGIVSLSYFLYLGAPFFFVPIATLLNLSEKRRIAIRASRRDMPTSAGTLARV